jgi:hypothetical protein
VARLLRELRWAGADGQVSALASRAAAHARLDDPYTVAGLLDAMREAGADGQVSVLLARDPAAHAGLDGWVARLLDALRAVGADGQVSALASRAVAHARLGNPDSAGGLLETVRKVGTRAEAAEVIERLPAAGLFELFCEQEGRAEKFRFGRKADGTPAKPWGWADISAYQQGVTTSSCGDPAACR